MAHKDQISQRTFRVVLHEIIFEADTPAGKLFDVLLIAAIIFSILIVMLDSVKTFAEAHGQLLNIAEWVFTILFSIEYLTRIYVVDRSWKYIFSFFGIVDFLAIIPTYISLVLVGSHYLLVIRVLRLLRIFRVFKLGQYLGEANMLTQALYASRRKIIVFLFAVMTSVVIIGSIMYVVEGEAHGFTSIPRSIYWAIVTLTTVGYGDISPGTPLGQFFASIIMILGYGIIAVPTGIVTSEMQYAKNHPATISTQSCQNCAGEGHDNDATFCKYCGDKL